MSATEQMRAMLDGLMGTARDGSDSRKQHLHFTDNKVCRAFLLDCCPHDIFASTKLELGECPKVHDPALRADYILANKTEDYMYEISALEKLQIFVNDADKKTEYLKRKLAETQEELTAEETNKLNRVHELTEKLGKKLAQVEKAEVDDDQVLKQKLIEESEKIKKERVIAEQEYRNVSRPASSHQQQNLRVCDICSAYLGINDNDSRLADHFGGKLHLGFITVREKLEDLKRICSKKKREFSSSSSSTSRRHGNSHSDRTSMSRDRNSTREHRDYDNYCDRRNHISRDYYDYRRSSGNNYYDSRDRYRDRYREREREGSSGSSSRYRSDSKYREKERSKPDSIFKTIFTDSEDTYQRRLREWEKREVDKARKHAIRQSDERDRKILEEQESRKLKEFLEDYKDDRDDVRFYRGSALARRLADRRKEIEQDELDRQKEKSELELLSRSCAAENSTPRPVECVNQFMPIEQAVGTASTTVTITNPPRSETITNLPTKPTSIANNLPKATTVSDSSNQTAATTIVNNNTNNTKSTSSEDKRKQVEELIGSIPTDKDQLFARKLDWSLLDDNLMEKRIRPWVTKKVAEYMGEKEADLIDFVCSQLTSHTEGAKVLREVAVVLDDEAEKFVVHMWRLLIFELEAKKIGLRK